MKTVVRDFRGAAASWLIGSQTLAEENDQLLAPRDRNPKRMPIIYSNAEGGYVLTQTDAWVPFQMLDMQSGFDTEAQQAARVAAVNDAYAQAWPTGKHNIGSLFMTTTGHTSEGWADEVVARYRSEKQGLGRDVNPNLIAYIQDLQDQIEGSAFTTPSTHMLVRLGPRSSGSKVVDFVQKVGEWINPTVALDRQPSPQEKAHWAKAARILQTTLGNSHLRLIPSSHEAMEQLVRHQAVPHPYNGPSTPADYQEWGAGQWATTNVTDVVQEKLGKHNHEQYGCVRIDGLPGRVYVSYLAIESLPGRIYVHNTHWAAAAHGLGFPVELKLDVQIHTTDDSRRILNKPVEIAKQQATEDAEAGHDQDQLNQERRALAEQANIEYALQRKKLATWSGVFAVYADTKEELMDRVTRLVDFYNTHFKMRLVCPAHLQKLLHDESMPGAVATIKSWEHRTGTAYFAAAMPNLSSGIGDPTMRSFYQGWVLPPEAPNTGARGMPWFWDSRNMVEGAAATAPTEFVAGESGGGKSVSRAAKPLLENALAGDTQVAWDPKGDLLAVAAHARKFGLNPAKIKVVDLTKTDGAVTLDAMICAEPHSRQAAAVAVFENICWKAYHSPQSGDFVATLVNRCVRHVLENATPENPATMRRVWAEIDNIHQQRGEIHRKLREDVRPSWEHAAEMVSEQIQFVAEHRYGRLLFLDSTEILVPELGDTLLFNAMGMKTSIEGKELGAEERIGDTISQVMCDLIREMMVRLPDNEPKHAFLDEWHVIRTSVAADGFLRFAARMFRSKKGRVTVLSQKAFDAPEGVTFTTVYVGKCNNPDDAIAGCKLLQIQPTQHAISYLMALGKGEFVMRDNIGRVAGVKVDIHPSVLELLDTNPDNKVALMRKLKMDEESIAAAMAAAAEEAAAAASAAA